MALLHSSWLYITLLWLYFSPLDSTLFYSGSTSLYLNLHHSTLGLLHSTSPQIILPSLYFTLLDLTLLYHGSILYSTWLYITPPWLYFSLLDSTLLYHSSTSLYLIHYSILALLHSTLLYITLALLHSAWLYMERTQRSGLSFKFIWSQACWAQS